MRRKGGMCLKKKKGYGMEKRSVIYLAGGCFWGTEHFMKQVRGVEKTRVGYANSALSDPSYEQVCSGATGAAETVEVVYDPAVVGLPLLLNLYFLTIDPTSLNRQGGDIGTQYRTGIYYTDTADLPFIREALSRTERSYDEPLVVEIGPLENFYPAEKYHQDYLDKNPGGYCHIDSRLFRCGASGEFGECREARASIHQTRRGCFAYHAYTPAICRNPAECDRTSFR